MIPKNLNTLPPEIRSHYLKAKIPCPKCGTILGERLTGKWEFMVRNGNKTGFKLGKTSGVPYTVYCPKKDCDGSVSFFWVNETLVASHSVDVNLAKEPVNKSVDGKLSQAV